MARATGVGVALLMGFVGSAVGQDASVTDASRAILVPQTQSFGEVYQFATVQAVFRVDNAGSQALRVVRVETAAGGMGTVDPGSAVIPPGGQATFRFRQAVGNRLGETSFRARLVFADGSDRKLILGGFLQSAYDPERVLLDYGRVAREAGAEQEVTVTTREGAELAILGLADGSAPWLEWRPRPGSRTSGALVVKPNAAPLGYREVGFGLATNLPRQPRIDGKLVLDVIGDWVPDRRQFDLSSVEIGRPATATIELRSRTGRSAGLKVSVDDPRIEASAAPCAEAPSGQADCWRLGVRVQPVEPGMITGVVTVTEEGSVEPLQLQFSVGALAIQPNTAIKKIRVPGAVESFADLFPPVESELDPFAVPAPIRERPAAPAGTPAEPTRERRVTIRWRARNDESVYGYLVYRAKAPEGPFQRLNAEIIRPSRLEFEHQYSFEDREVERGRTYWYTVDVVSKGGRKFPFSPVLSRSIASDAAE